MHRGPSTDNDQPLRLEMHTRTRTFETHEEPFTSRSAHSHNIMRAVTISCTPSEP